MSIIDQFLEDYKQRMDSYDRLAQLCAVQCERSTEIWAACACDVSSKTLGQPVREGNIPK